MKKARWMTCLVAGLLQSMVAHPGWAAQPPYPHSDVIERITWQRETW